MNNKTAKFGITAAVIVTALIFLASCEIPQSARIKASPTLQIPIPLGEGTNNSFLSSYININEIRKGLQGDQELNKGIDIYEYNSEGLMTAFEIPTDGSNPAQTYLITYPLFDLSLDFNEYLNGTLMDTDQSRVPPVDISIEISNQAANAVEGAIQGGNLESGNLPYYRWIDPFQGNSPEVDLGDMKNLVSDITFNDDTSFSIRVGNGNAEEMKKAIRIRVPQLEIGGERDNSEASWVEGELNGDRTKLVFKSTNIDPKKPLLLISDGTNPRKADSEKIEIHVRLVNKIGAAQYGTELNFNWYSAKIKPNDTDKFSGQFKGFNLDSYLTTLGSGVTFAAVPAYLYVEAPNGFDVTIGVSSLEKDFLLKQDDVLGENPAPDWIMDNTPSNPSKYDFTTDSSNISYAIKVPEDGIDIYNVDADRHEKITANLAVLLPMVFKFTGGEIQIEDDPDTTEENERGSYYPVKFEGLDDFLGSGGNSTGSVMDDINKQLGEGSVTRLTLRLRDIDNKVTSPIYLAVATDPTVKNPGPDDWKIVKIAAGADGRDIDIKNVESLTNLPPIKFLVKGEEGQGGRLYIQSQDDKDSIVFSVKISVVAGINLDKPIDL
jgi:hypothetical protein